MFPYWVWILLRVVADMPQHRLQVLQVEQQQSIVVRDLEDQRQHPLLSIVQAEKPAEEQRPHLRNRGANRMALLAKDIPEGDRAATKRKIRQLHLFHARGDLGTVGTWLADSD